MSNRPAMVGESFVARGGRMAPLNHGLDAKKLRVGDYSLPVDTVVIPMAASPTDQSDSLNLVTSIRIFSNFRPQSNPPARCFSMDEETSNRITSFELNSSDPSTIALALHELLIQVEDDECDRFYVLDEHMGSCAVVCGPQTAFWYGTTPAVRNKLNLNGITYKLSSAHKQVERRQDFEVAVTGKLAQECTLFFSTALEVRGLVEALINSKPKLRILSSGAFPNCLVKTCQAQYVVSKSQQQQEQWITTMEGAYFNSLEVDRFLQAFHKHNPGAAAGVKVKMQTSQLTADFDRACQALYKDGDEDDE